jgi:hypothetical protein
MKFHTGLSRREKAKQSAGWTAIISFCGMMVAMWWQNEYEIPGVNVPGAILGVFFAISGLVWFSLKEHAPAYQRGRHRRTIRVPWKKW